MSQDEDDLRATAESIVADAERLVEIENEKLVMSLDDPKVVELSDEAEAIAAKLAVKTAAEASIVEEGTAPKR